MVKPKISVLIPVYNCEEYIYQCVESLMEQTYDNIEYLFVDDASTDDSLSILKEVVYNYPHRVSQVIIIELLKNKGVANARQIGIDAMTGEYFAFCDSDDWIEKNAFDKMYSAIELAKADIICTPFFINTPQEEYTRLFNKKDFGTLNDIPLDVLHFSLCTKLIRRELLRNNNLRFFEDVNCWEDLSILARIFTLTDNIVILDTPFYHYRKGNTATLTSGNHKNILDDHLLCAEKLEEWFIENNKAEQYNKFLLFLKFTAKIKLLRGKEKDIAKWKDTFPETNAHISNFENIPTHFKLLFHLANTLPIKLTQSIANKFKIFYK